MKKFLPIKFIIFIIFINFIFVFPKAICAQEKVSSLTAIPPKLELTAKPGETLQELVKLRNESTTEKAFDAYIKDFIVTDDQGTPIAVEEETSNRWSMASWMYTTPTKAVIKPEETRSFAVSINVPADALPGGHYAMVIFRPLTGGELGEDTSGAGISQEIGILVSLQVEGEITENAVLTKFKTDKNLEEFGPVNFFSTIENLSDIHIKPQGKIVIENVLLSKIIDRPTRILNLEEVNIFPLASRNYENQLPGKWHFGQYRATLTASYGTQGKTLEGVIYFWIVPISAIAAVLVPTLILIAALLYIARHVHKTKQK